MIRSFKCEHTQALSKGHRVKQFVNFSRVARRKLRQLEIATRLDDLRVPPGNHLEALKRSKVIVLVNTASELTISGGYAFAGLMQVLKKSKSLITIEEFIL